MCAVRTRPDEVDIDAALVGRLVAGRFPRRAGLPVERLRSSGTENAMFRLGPDPVVRLPRYPGAVEGVAHEQRWLPRLGPLLPFAVPEPIGRGGPGAGFPWPWSVYRRLDGADPVVGALDEPEAPARDLAAFVAALRGIDATDGPAYHRGAPLVSRDAPTREAIAHLTGRIDTAAVADLWEEALGVPEHTGAPVWAHR